MGRASALHEKCPRMPWGLQLELRENPVRNAGEMLGVGVNNTELSGLSRYKVAYYAIIYVVSIPLAFRETHGTLIRH